MDINKSIAKEIQSRLSPVNSPEIEGYEYLGICKSADEVGGDSFDILKLPAQRSGFLVADVSGKGLLGSLRMAMTLSEFRLFAQGGLSPSACMWATNEAIFPDIKGRRFVSMVYASLDSKQHHLTMVNAGHNPAYLIRSGNVEELKPKGIALGVVDSSQFHSLEKTLELEKGDLLAFYSDGVTEARNGGPEEYGEERLKSFLKRHAADPLSEIRDGVLKEIDSFVQGAEQHDDMTLLLLRRL